MQGPKQLAMSDVQLVLSTLSLSANSHMVGQHCPQLFLNQTVFLQHVLTQGILQKFACGVVSWNGQYVLVDSGSLPEAVAASAAVPFLFANVDIPGMRQILL